MSQVTNVFRDFPKHFAYLHNVTILLSITRAFPFLSGLDAVVCDNKKLRMFKMEKSSDKNSIFTL